MSRNFNQRREEVKRLHAQGLTPPEIVTKLGEGRQTVYSDLKTLGLTPHTKTKISRMQQISDLKMAGYSSREIATKLGMRIGSVYTAAYSARKRNGTVGQSNPTPVTNYEILRSEKHGNAISVTPPQENGHANDSLVAYAAGHTKAWLEQYARSVGMEESALMSKVGLMILGRGR